MARIRLIACCIVGMLWQGLAFADEVPTAAPAKAKATGSQNRAVLPLKSADISPRRVMHLNEGIAKPSVTPRGRDFTVTGEVVDSWCYASKSVGDGRGPEHYRCAEACAHGGVTLAIVDDSGNMYIAAKTRAYTGCQYLLEPFVAKRVVVKGWLAQLGGCNILKIDTVKLATDKPQPKLPGMN